MRERQAAKFSRAFQFKTANSQLISREGILIRSRDRVNSLWSYGEASPVNGHSAESIEKCWDYLNGKSKEAPASVRFALDTEARWPEILLGPATPVKSNAVIDLDIKLERVEALVEMGYRTFKLKVSPKNATEVLDLMKAIIGCGIDPAFRLDASASFDQKSIIELARVLGDFPVEYIEDPCAPDFVAWNELHALGLSVAVDQGLISIETIENMLEKYPFTVGVLKPTVLGGEREIRAAAALLERAGKRTVLTSSLETEIGRASVISLAAKLLPNETHGVSTGRFFSENFLPDRALYRGPLVFDPRWSEFVASLVWERIA